MKETGTISTIEELSDYIIKNPLFLSFSQGLSKNRFIQQEIYSDFLITVCENKDKMINLYNKKQFNYYAIAMLKNSVKNKYSTVNKNFKFDVTKYNGPFTDYITNTYTGENDSIINEKSYKEYTDINKKLKKEIIKYVSTLRFDEQEIFTMYFIEKKTHRDIVKETSIPKTSVYKAIKAVKNKINNKFYNKYNKSKNINIYDD